MPLPPARCNFLQFTETVWHVDSIWQSLSKMTKKLRKVAKTLLKILISVFSKHSIVSSEWGSFKGNSIDSVPEIILLLCFRQERGDILSFTILHQFLMSINNLYF